MTGRVSPTGNRAVYVLFLLFMVNVLNFVDRTLLGIVNDPVKSDLALSDTQMSLVSGLAFVLFNLCVGVFIARWVDHGNRKWILMSGIALWSFATGLSGVAQGFASLVIARILVGIGEATAFPVAISLIADLYEAETRPRAIAVFQSSTFVGIVAGAIIAGVLADAFGWRAMFIFCGAIGLLVVILVATTLHEPGRGGDGAATEAQHSTRMSAAIGQAIRLPGFAPLAFGTAFATMAVGVLPIWAPAFFMRSHDVPLASLGAAIGPAVGFGGLSGTIVAGLLATQLVRRRGDEAASLLVPLVGLPLSACAFLLFILAPTLPLALLGVAIVNFFLASAIGPCYAAAVALAHVNLRALVSTLMLTLSSVLGGGLAPLIVGVASDAFEPMLGRESLRMAMATMAPMPLFGSIALFYSYQMMRSRGGNASGAAGNLRGMARTTTGGSESRE